jgi:hypothetical protein
MPFSADDMVSQTRIGAFLQALALSGWAIGRNMRIDATARSACPLSWMANTSSIAFLYAKKLAGTGKRERHRPASSMLCARRAQCHLGSASPRTWLERGGTGLRGGLELTWTSIGLAELGERVIAQAIGVALARLRN